MLAVLTLLAATAGPVPEIDLESVLIEAKQTLQSDLELWKHVQFRRDGYREKLDEHDNVSWTLSFAMTVTAQDEGFDEELFEIEGRKPTEREVRKYRSDAKFTKHYKELLTGEVDHALMDEGLSMPAILEAGDYAFGGREEVQGVPCLRLDFQPGPEDSGELVDRIADAIEGSLWLSEDGYHLVAWDTRLVRPLRKSIATIRLLELRVKAEPILGGWLATEIQLHSEVKLGPKMLRKRNRYRYSDFRELSRGGSH